jgi:hypothetical protein
MRFVVVKEKPPEVRLLPVTMNAISACLISRHLTLDFFFLRATWF